MHTLHGKMVHLHFNGDFSGDVIVMHKGTGQEMHVPFEDFKLLVAHCVMMQKISKLEQASPDEILGLVDRAKAPAG